MNLPTQFGPIWSKVSVARNSSSTVTYQSSWMILYYTTQFLFSIVISFSIWKIEEYHGYFLHCFWDWNLSPCVELSVKACNYRYSSRNFFSNCIIFPCSPSLGDLSRWASLDSVDELLLLYSIVVFHTALSICFLYTHIWALWCDIHMFLLCFSGPSLITLFYDYPCFFACRCGWYLGHINMKI